MEQDISQIKVFLESYKEFSQEIEGYKIENYRMQFGSLLQGYCTVKNIYNRFNQYLAENYNIFSILNIRVAEVKLHTPFLVNLFNPRSTHGQGSLFLMSFLERFIPQNKLQYFILDDPQEYRVTEERIFDNGRIDILIDTLNTKKKFGLIIENKLHANDQEKQIERYYEFLKRIYSSEKQRIIFYLTIDGKKPSGLSISAEEYENLSKSGNLINISYRVGIYNWLLDLLPVIKAEKVSLIIKQYLNILEII